MFARRTNWMLLVAVSVSVNGLLDTNAVGAEKEIVSFRLTKWKAAHFDDEKSAKKSLQTFKQIGCEVEQQQHGGHFDVRYRCGKWRSISLSSHKEAHQWERWLKAYGFETSHRH